MQTDTSKGPRGGCAVNSTFNFGVGAVSIVAALLIGYCAYRYWWV